MTDKRRCAGCTSVIDGRANKLYCSKTCRDRVHIRRKRHPESDDKLSAVSTVIKGSNGVLIAKVARLGYLGGPASTVLDTTYGRGGFWTRLRPAGLVVSTADFRNLPQPDNSVEVVCYDPPYISTGNREKSSVDDLYDRFGLGEINGWKAIRQLIDDGLTECARVLAPRGYLLVKCMDYTESGRKVWNTFHVHAEGERLGLRLVDRFHHLTGGGPQPTTNLDGSPREQKGAREVTSMLLVFTKVGCRAPESQSQDLNQPPTSATEETMTTPYDEQLRLLQTYGDPVRIDGHHTKPGTMATRDEHAAGLALEAAELHHTIAIIELRKAQLDQLSDQWPDDMPLGDFIAR